MCMCIDYAMCEITWKIRASHTKFGGNDDDVNNFELMTYYKFLTGMIVLQMPVLLVILLEI